MRNAVGEPQSIVLFGGTSEIGRSIVGHLVGPATTTIVLACRRPDAAHPEAFAAPGRTVAVERFDAASVDDHAVTVRKLTERHGDIDIAVLAFGVLGSQPDFDADPGAAAAAVHVNYTASVALGLSLADVMRQQGHGHMVFVSSVAAERVRAANFVYGSSKAGLDAFAQGLGDALVGTGVDVTVVRPGFVHTKMTDGRPAQPFATTPDVVGAAAAAGIRRRRHTVWAPRALRYAFVAVRHLPRSVFRRLPER